MPRLRTNDRFTKICPACGERTRMGSKTCSRKGCTYSWAKVKYREDNCRQNYIIETSILNPVNTFSLSYKDSKNMNTFTAEDNQFAKLVPPGVRYLGNNQYFEPNGRPIGDPKFAATYEGFENNRIFYANDRNKLMGLIWRIRHCNLKNMPSDYKKNGCGVER